MAGRDDGSGNPAEQASSYSSHSAKPHRGQRGRWVTRGIGRRRTVHRSDPAVARAHEKARARRTSRSVTASDRLIHSHRFNSSSMERFRRDSRASHSDVAGRYSTKTYARRDGDFPFLSTRHTPEPETRLVSASTGGHFHETAPDPSEMPIRRPNSAREWPLASLANACKGSHQQLLDCCRFFA